MSPTTASKNSCNFRALLLLVTYSTAIALLVLSPKSGAAEWEFVPRTNIRLHFTDNISLVPNSSPDKEADFVTQLIPGFFSNFTSPRFNSTINYSLINIIFAKNSDRNRSFHNLDARNTAELYENHFFVDGNVRMRQQNQSILAPQGDVVNLTGNLRNIRQYSISPYLLERFGNLATTELRYARVLTDSDASTTFFNSQANIYNASVISGPAFRTLEWGLNYSRQDIDFDLRPDSVRLETEIANIQYNFTRRFGLTATGGYESNNFGQVNQDDPKGVRWSAGFIWVPSQRTSLEASAGQRFFGDTYAFNFEHQTRLFAFSSSYRENISSVWQVLNLDATGDTGALLNGILTDQVPPGTDPAEIARLVQLIIVELGLPSALAFDTNYLSNRFFLQKRFISTVLFNSAKNTVIFRVFHTTRTPLEVFPILDGLFGGLQVAHIKQKGANMTWSHQLSKSGRTRVNFNLLYRRLKFPTLFRIDHNYRAEFTISHSLSENILALVQYRLNKRTSNAVGNEFTENRFTLALNVRY